MEAMVTEVLRQCVGFQIWYKLYADDLIITVSHQHLEHFLAILHNVSNDFYLIINTKYNIFATKKHRKIDETMDLKGIPVLQEYTYLGVTIDDSGSLWPQLDKINKRSNYLRSSMQYYTHNLYFENHYLLWEVYIRPYFLYTASVIKTQNQTLQNRFHSSWWNSSKLCNITRQSLKQSSGSHILPNSSNMRSSKQQNKRQCNT
jgi:hypothetical protein